ncbi:DUF1707 SHOCT-like domain-containing protein [Nocardiopsis halophila]|uniref:DUF1707 SHOCT-like domain-containing protein n=1 Tax=Nocardiopsis halophila TaxID=141692 RepID=UPI00034AECBC|nr:DUF1707 domain-containing protein [Nocardiopsis halophila]
MEPEKMRASDADREQVAERLREGLAEGRLDQAEHSERLDALYRAKTVGELAEVTRDLPLPSAEGGRAPDYSSPEAQRLLSQSQGRENIVAVFGGAERKGRWLVEPRTNVSAMFGGIELDFREAVLARREITVQCAVLFGGLEITVPHGVRVVNTTTAIFGGTSLNGTDAVTDPNAPVIRLTGTCMFGGIEVKAKKPKRKKNA